MKLRGTPLKGFTLDAKSGKLKRNMKGVSVSKRIAQKKSKKVTPKRGIIR